MVEDIGDRDGREGQHEDPGGRRGTHRRCRRAARPSLHPARLPRPGFRQRLQLSPEPSERPVTRPVSPARPAPLPCAQPPAAAVQTREAPSLPSRQGAPRYSRQLGELGGGDSPLPGTGAPVTLRLCGKVAAQPGICHGRPGDAPAELWASGGRSQTRGVRVGRACKSIHVGNPRPRVQKGQMTLKPGNLSTESHQRAASTVPAWSLKPHFQPRLLAHQLLTLVKLLNISVFSIVCDCGFTELICTTCLPSAAHCATVACNSHFLDLN